MFSLLLFLGPPVFFGWQGFSVAAPILWWAFLALLAVFNEYRPNPAYNELKSRSMAFAGALVAFVAVYYVARGLASA